VLADIKSSLRVGDTLVPLIFMSDRTHLSNFAGYWKDWPVYITIGTLTARLRQMPSTHCAVIVALLSIRIKKRNIPQMRLGEQQRTNLEVLN
jgi:hypothetical protein